VGLRIKKSIVSDSRALLQARRFACLSVFCLVIVTIGSGAGCENLPPYIPPRATIVLSPPPVEVDAAALYREWVDDSEGALNKYKSTGLLFRKIIVEELVKTGEKTEPFIRNGRVKFIIGVPEDLTKIRIGDPVDVVGKLRGIENDEVIISDCWVRFVDTRKPQGY
jgi:hypothetical protein